MPKRKLENICILCHSQMKYFLSGKDLRYRTSSRVFKIYKCMNCGLEEVLPLPKFGDITKFYPKNYDSFHLSEKAGFRRKFNELFLRGIFLKKSKFVKRLTTFLFDHFFYVGLPESRKGKVLDIGCGDGADVYLMRKYGIDAYGFEVGKKNYFKDRIFYAKKLKGSNFRELLFAYIRIWHVLEHVPNPIGFMAQVNKLLIPGGALEIALPNTRSLNAKLFKKYWYSRDIPRHLFNYDPANIKLLLNECGFEVIKIRSQSVNGVVSNIQRVLDIIVGKNTGLGTNFLIVILFYPFEFAASVLGISDSMVVTARKKWH